MRFLFSFFSPPHRFYVSLPPRRKDEDTQRSTFNRKIVNRKIVNITMILFFRTPSKSVIAVECNHELPQADSDKLCWLFGEATPESEDNLKGHFVGPRREMITPWSTNAVEITQNMGLDGIIRIEEYFPVKDENADHDPMLQRMYKGLDQNVFTTNRQPEPIVHIEDLEAYNEKEGLALSKEEMNYLKKVEKDLGRPLTDSEVFGFAQINSEHCRHKIFGGTFIIDGVEQESSLFQMIKKTTQENPNKIISAYKDNVAFAEGPVIEQFAPADHSKPDYFQVKDIKSVISLKAETHNFPTTVEPFNGASTGTGGEIRDRMGGGKGSWPIAGTAVYMTSYPRTEEGRPWEEILPVRKWLYQTPEQILIKASNGASDFGNKFGQPLICGSVLTFEHKEKDEVYGYDKVIMLAGGVGYGTQRDCLKGTPEAGNKVVVIGGDGGFPNLSELQELAAFRPVVGLNAELPGIPSVYNDDVIGGRLVAECFRRHGHRRVALLGSGGYFALPRFRAFEAFFAERGIAPLRLSTPAEALERCSEFSAVFCGNDYLAAALCSNAASAGIRIPDRFSVIGYDGLDWLKLLSPRPGTVVQHKGELGEAIAAQLLRAFDCGSCESVRFVPQLEIGDTVGPA